MRFMLRQPGTGREAGMRACSPHLNAERLASTSSLSGAIAPGHQLLQFWRIRSCRAGTSKRGNTVHRARPSCQRFAFLHNRVSKSRCKTTATPPTSVANKERILRKPASDGGSKTNKTESGFGGCSAGPLHSRIWWVTRRFESGLG